MFYAILQGTGSCSSPALACNANTAPSFPLFATVVDPEFTGVSGALALSALVNAGNVVDNNPASYAEITTTLSVAGTATLALKDVTTDYPAGTYAGFDIQNPTLANVGLLSNLAIRTYRDGVFQEARSGTGLLLGASVLSNGSRQKIGFVATLPFDEVQLALTQPAVGVDLGTTRVYSAILKSFCAGPPLPCNTPVALDEAVYPVYVNISRTGLGGAACVACRIDSVGNLIDGNAATGATIALAAGALSSGSIAVKDALTQYDSGTFAGFDIQNAALLDVGVLTNFTVSTYLNGTFRESFSGNTLLAGVSTNLLNAPGRLTIGNVTTKTFDELRITATQTVGVDLGITKVYGASLTNFCSTPLNCSNTTYWLNRPAFPVFIDGTHTGSTGAACVACNVSNPENVISNATTHYALLTPVAGVAATVAVSVKDAIHTYPAGTIAGFAIAELNNVLQVDLFKTLTISTYNNGVLQERRFAGQLLNLSALILHINPTNGAYTIGFATALPFDEVQIGVTPLVGVLPLVRVYGAFADTRYVVGDILGSTCIRLPTPEPDYLSTVFNTPVNGSLRTNDRDPQGLPLTYNPTAAVVPANGTVGITSGGGFTYTPNAGFSGVDSFQYTVCNTGGLCANQWAYISVLPARTPGAANRAPLAQSDFGQTLAGVAVSGNARSNDIDPDGNVLAYTLVNAPANGSLTVDADGRYRYTPDSAFVGTDTALIQVCDNGSPVRCVTSLLRILVVPDSNGAANDAPFAQDDNVGASVNTYAVGNVLTNDSDPEAKPLSASLLDTVAAASGALYFSSNGGFTFVPASGFVGTVSVRYQACDDGAPARCDTATLTITVVPVAGPDFTPLLLFDSTRFSTAGAPRDFLLTIKSLNGNASNSPIIVRLIKPSAFSVSYNATDSSSAANGGVPVNNNDWSFTENALYITCQLKAGVTLAGNAQSTLGFRIARKPNIAPATFQNITATILNGSGGDNNNANNQSTENLETR